MKSCPALTLRRNPLISQEVNGQSVWRTKKQLRETTYPSSPKRERERERERERKEREREDTSPTNPEELESDDSNKKNVHFWD